MMGIGFVSQASFGTSDSFIDMSGGGDLGGNSNGGGDGGSGSSNGNSNNSAAYKDYFKAGAEKVANTDYSLGGGDPIDPPKYNGTSVAVGAINEMPEVVISGKGGGSDVSGGISTGASLVSSGVGITSSFVYNAKNGSWVGKNLVEYSTSWGGNGYTGGKNSFAKNLSGNLSNVGTGLSVFNAGVIQYQYSSGQINSAEYGIEQASNAISTRVPAWGMGWELGRLITNITGYHENVRVPLRKLMGINPDCGLCPN